MSLVIVTIAGNAAKVLFAGLAPGLHGVYQLNVQPAPYSGNQIQVGAGSFTSTALTLPIPVGTNATNVKGLVEQWYPGSGTQLGFSALPLAGGFDFDLDIAPNAKPFGISASVTGEGTAIVASVAINPLLNTWTANYTVPSQNSRNWDFSTAGFKVIDFLTGGQFPGGIIPQSRIDPTASSAIRSPATLSLRNGGGRFHARNLFAQGQ